MSWGLPVNIILWLLGKRKLRYFYMVSFICDKNNRPAHGDMLIQTHARITNIEALETLRKQIEHENNVSHVTYTSVSLINISF